MSNQLSTFDFNTSSIRVVTLEGTPWFVAKDVLEALDMDIAKGSGKYLQHLDETEKKLIKKPTPENSGGSFPNRGAVCLSESGLYKLTLRSTKPGAKSFQDWVTKVVLPTLRKEGSYVVGEEKVETGEMSEDDMMAKMLLVAHAKVRKAEETPDDTLRRLSGIRNIAAGATFTGPNGVLAG